jgi:hypothetical protein
MVQEPRPGSLPAYRRGSRLVVRGGRGLEPVTSLLLKRASPRSRRLRRLLEALSVAMGSISFEAIVGASGLLSLTNPASHKACSICPQ